MSDAEYRQFDVERREAGKYSAAEIEEERDIASALHCALCGWGISRRVLDFPTAEVAPNGVSILPGGIMVIHRQEHFCVVYCAKCAPGVSACRVCGCTDEAACPQGCSWVLPGLCSECALKEEEAGN